MSVPSLLYRRLSRCIRDFQNAKVPLLGVAGLETPTAAMIVDSTPKAQLAKSFRDYQRPSDIDVAFRALRALPRQLHVLCQADSTAREALWLWYEFISNNMHSSESIKSEEVSPALHFITRCTEANQLIAHMALAVEREGLGAGVGQGLEPCDADENSGIDKPEALVNGLSSGLDALADHVAQQRPDMLSSASNATTAEKFLALSQVLYVEERYRYEPIEWVYDRLCPALLPDVLLTRKGTPLMLALLGSCVAQRLAVPALPLCIRSELVDSAQGGPDPTLLLPPEVAARQRARTPASAPPPDEWVLVSVDESIPKEQQVVVEFGRRPTISRWHEAVTRLPALQQQPLPTPDAPLLLRIVQSAIDTLVTAHTRRGESDAVAHWMMSALALNPSHPAWDMALSEEVKG